MANQPITVVWQHKTKITYKHYSDLMDYEDADKIGQQYGYGRTIVIGYSLPLKKRLLNPIKHFIKGIHYRYPICCILNYCLDTILDRPSAPLRFTETLDYIVCTLHYKKYSKRVIPKGYY